MKNLFHSQNQDGQVTTKNYVFIVSVIV